MAENEVASGDNGDAGNGGGWRRILLWIATGILLVFIVAAVVLWTQREPLARDFIERELEKRGAAVSYEIDQLSLRTQQLSKVVVGDADNPSLTAERVRVETRVKLDGSVDVYRIVARGVRLRGELLPSGRVSWGELDKLLPPPSGEPFRLPDVAVDVQNTAISLRTPYGPIGVALSGEGNLTGGFEGRAVVRSPGIDFGNCSVTNVRAGFDIGVAARHPLIEGPFTVERIACPDSNFIIDSPRFAIDARFSEGFDTFEGSGRLSADNLVAGLNRLSRVTGELTFDGNPGDTTGRIELAARRAKAGPILAERTTLEGRYSIDAEAGTQQFVGEYAATDAQLAGDIVAGAAGPLEALAKTPLGPIATKLARGIQNAARSFDATGDIRVVNAPRGGFAAIETAQVRSDSGARVDVAGDRGIRFAWPSGQLAVDGTVRIRGGGLPDATISLDQRSAGGPLSGVARIAPYEANGARIDLSPVRFAANTDGTTRFQTVGRLTGAFPDGRVRGLQVPIEGQIGPAGKLTVARNCVPLSFESFTFGDLTLARDRVTLCPTDEAVIVQPANGELRIGARLIDPDLSGTLGGTPIRLAADRAQITGKDFMLDDARMALGKPDSPVVVTADRLTGTFRGAGISGNISNATAVIANVPLRMSEIDGEWLFRRGDLTIDGDVLVSDRAEDPRFYPLHSRDFRFLLSGNDIRAGGTLRHPESGTEVMDVAVAHDLATGAGRAGLDVDGLTFGQGLQPEELTRLTEGVVARVEGTLFGEGLIQWDGDGETTSTGTFTTTDTNLLAPFGPVAGLTTTIHFSDLLALETPPGQIAQVDLVNPGIEVRDGVIRYQILPNQLVKIEEGLWPFMGGRLILHETILDFGAPTAKRLTFEVVGLDAAVFVNQIGFEELEMTGTFDGVLPLIFDDHGARIVGGRLDSRLPGGRIVYQGDFEDLGFFAKIALETLTDLRYRGMTIRINGDLAGEFDTRITLDHIALGESTGASILQFLTRDIRFKLNISIRGPFRSIIRTLNSLEDPTSVISPVLPFPIESPALVKIPRRIEDESEAEVEEEPGLVSPVAIESEEQNDQPND